jgi:hypothetical protein
MTSSSVAQDAGSQFVATLASDALKTFEDGASALAVARSATKVFEDLHTSKAFRGLDTHKAFARSATKVFEDLHTSGTFRAFEDGVAAHALARSATKVFEDLHTSGAFRAFEDGASALAVARSATKAFDSLAELADVWDAQPLAKAAAQAPTPLEVRALFIYATVLLFSIGLALYLHHPDEFALLFDLVTLATWAWLTVTWIRRSL